MKPTSRLSVVASLIAALCIAPAALAKPKDDQGGGKPGKGGKPGGQTAPGGGQTQGPGGVQTRGPGVTQTRGPSGPGGVGIVIVRPPMPPPPPYYRRDSYRHSDYADSTVASVQRALKTRGYYAGPVDGDAGSGTRAAIRGFRADHGLAPSSGIDGPLLRALRL